MGWRWLLLAAAGAVFLVLLGGCGTSGPPPPLDLRVMTYNVLSAANKSPGVQAVRDQGYGSELPLSIRMPVAAEKIALLDPDLIGIQENEGPGRLPISYLRAALPGYSVLFADDSDPMLVRAGRFQVIESGLRAPTDGDLTCRASTTARPRCITWAILLDVPTGRELLIVNTHAPAGEHREAAEARAANAAAIARLLADKTDGETVALVMGDFNEASNERRKPDAPLTALRARGMVDTAEIAARDDSDVPRASSANWFTDEIDGELHAKVIRRGGGHLDYIWVSAGTEVRSWQTLSGPDIGTRRIAGKTAPSWTGVMASDHSPVAADVRVQ